MNWSVIVLGLVALSSVAIAENSYLVILPKLLKVGSDNQLSVYIAAASRPVEVKFELIAGQKRVQCTATVKSGETRNATLALPMDWPVGPAELSIVGTGGITFQDKRDVIVYDNRYVILVQTSASTYRPGDDIDVRVIVTNEELMPVESGELLIEIYDSNLNIVGQFPPVRVNSGITESFKFPLSSHCNIGTWLVSATMGNTTSSVQVLVAKPITPSFDLKAIFQRFLLRTDKTLRGVIEIDCDDNKPLFGRATIAIGQITEQDIEVMMKQQEKPVSSKPEPMNEEWRKWKSQEIDIAGRVEINYDLLSLFNIDVSKVLAVQVYIQVTELTSGHERFIQHVVPIFTRDVIYDIRPLEFEAGIKNEFEIIAKRPDGKPAKMEDLIVSVRMIMGNEQGKIHEEKSVEIKDFYTRGRTDIGFFMVEVPQNCIGVLMTITPLSEDGKVRGYRTHAIPLRPIPRPMANAAKLTIELLPSTTSQADANPSVVSSQISTVGRTSNFYIQLLPSKPVEKYEPIPVSWVLLTNGRITLTGEFNIQPTKECQSKAQRSIKPEEQTPPACVFNGTLPVQITRKMMPYSTLFVYVLQPSLGFSLAESYRFSVAGLFQNPLMLNATVVPAPMMNSMISDEDMNSYQNLDSMEEMDLKSVSISDRAQGKSRVELSFTGTPDSTVGLNVVEYDAVIQGLSSEITRERVLQYLTAYEQVPIVGMPMLPPSSDEQPVVQSSRGAPDSDDDDQQSTTMTMADRRFQRRAMMMQDRLHDVESSTLFHETEDEDLMHHMDTTTHRSGMKSRAVVSEAQEEANIAEQPMIYRFRYPIAKMIFGAALSHSPKTMEGDDVYTVPNLEHLYGEKSNQRPQSFYRRRGLKSFNQYDISVGDNDFVVATSAPLAMKVAAMTPPPTPSQNKQQRPKPEDENDDDVNNQSETQEQDSRSQGPQYGTPAWYEKMHSKLNSFSLEAFKFMQSGLSVVTDFPSLRIPTDMRRTNFTKLFSHLRQQSLSLDSQSFNIRDEARQLLADYLSEGSMSMVPPEFMLEEHARTGYYRSLFFNTSRIESQGTGKVVLPRIKPYSTWLATGFSLNAKSGLSIAQPIRLPTNQGLFILGNFPQEVQIGEHALLTYGVNNYLGKDLTNVVVRIRASADFDIIEPNQPVRAASANGKDYTVEIPALKTLGVEIRNVTLVPKRAGVVKILLEVESEFGGDFEVLTVFVRESGIKRVVNSVRLIDLSSDKKTYGPIVEKITQSPTLRSVCLKVSGTGLEHLLEKHTTETSSLVGVDRAIIRLWRLMGLGRYLNETSQMQTVLLNETMGNMTKAYQKLQLYGVHNGSYSFISDQGEQISSLYLTSFAFGALISPLMPVRDNVTINRTLSWILSQQQADGSFDDQGPCFHYRFCTGEYRRESLTALVLYSMTHNNVSDFVPEFVRRRLYQGEQSPVARAQRYLESRLDAVKSCVLTTSLVELALVQCRSISEQLRQKIMQDVRSRQLTVVPEDGSKYYKMQMANMTHDDEVLVNSLTLSLYANFNDLKTTSEIARWVVRQMEEHPYYDTVLDAVFGTQAWFSLDCLFRQRFGFEKISLIVDVSTDNGQKQQFKIDSSNMDVIQRMVFTLPVNQITYKVSGSGIAVVCIKQNFVEQQQQPQTTQPTPFQLSTQFTPMSWLSEIKAETCVTYSPSPKDLELAKGVFNRTVIVQVQLPSGMRINLRQIGFFLSRVPEAMYFTFSERCNTLSFFLNVPTSGFNKQICLNWCLERLSFVSTWAPIRIRAYDYLTPDSQLTRLIPIKIQPDLLGYSFVDAVHKARPSLEELAKPQPKIRR